MPRRAWGRCRGRLLAVLLFVLPTLTEQFSLVGTPRWHARAFQAHQLLQHSRMPRKPRATAPFMLFSIPDFENLLFAPSNRRFFNPIWYPYFARETYVHKVQEVSQGTMWSGPRDSVDMWSFEQPIGFLNITVNIRMTVVRLKDGSLFVHNPIAPTGECVERLRELGEVKHIVLGATAIEHKFFCRSFIEAFPEASLYVCPGVFNYVPGRADFAPPGLGLFVDLLKPARIDGFLTEGFREAELGGRVYPESSRPVWADEIDHTLLFLDTSIANLGEVTFFHAKTRTLFVTDSMTYIGSKVPDWQTENGSRNRSLPFNNYPREWDAARKKALDQMQILTIQTPYKDEDLLALADRLYVCPQLRLFVFETDPELAKKWLTRVLAWDSRWVVASHFDAPVSARPQEIKAAFSFILDRPASASQAPLPEDHCMGVQKAVQILLRRTLFRNRLASGSVQQVEYAGLEENGQYVGRIRLPLVGDVTL
mmetsp:Transcript_6062/g.15443  ORF Transcript_6062/g.15443 Transcript_6062/m.15443 type:complete len:481 (-) Transcript_6062:1120-2562(-)